MNKSVILLTGCLGQLGTAIKLRWDASMLATVYELLPVDADQLDLTDFKDVRAYLDQLKPRYIINTAAYTHVDDAELASETAFAVNADAVLELALWCKKHNSTLIHVSTDFVFDGQAKSPYLPDAVTRPLSVYGASKLAGERHVRDTLPYQGVIVRTAWLYSEFGRNFLKTMLTIMKERPELNIVDDQIGSPTSAHTLADFILALVDSGTTNGTYHWTDGAAISWFDFANAIHDAARAYGLLKENVSILPIPGSEYPARAVRPSYSVLDRTSALTLIDGTVQDWRTALNHVVMNLARMSETDEIYGDE